jgi:AcrR family transcriptional regulator
MARPRNADGQRTRQAILDAALDLFGERGFFGTSLRDVARAVGVRESALYNYFLSKDALFEALIAAGQDTKRERWSSVLEGPIDDPRPVLERLVRLSLEDFATSRQQHLFRILMSDGLRLARAGRLNLVDRMGSGHLLVRETMQGFIDRGWFRDTEPDVLALNFSGPLLVWRHMLALHPDAPLVRDPDAFARLHVEQFLHGAVAPGQPGRRTGPRRARSSRQPGARRRPATRQRT